MQQLPDFDSAARAILFREKDAVAPVRQGIPGQGTSAAKTPKRHTRVKITINLDGDIVQRFKERAEENGVGYQVLINQALREALDGDCVERLVEEVGEELLSNESFLESVAKRIENF